MGHITDPSTEKKVTLYVSSILIGFHSSPCEAQEGAPPLSTEVHKGVEPFPGSTLLHFPTNKC